mmetsp:Transcript_12705/g.12555  ORF Transcript_12705/g.12555 Transcript_12705/m.12555 type:complete len:122 (-) Transcript_12705:753-1118(-)
MKADLKLKQTQDERDQLKQELSGQQIGAMSELILINERARHKIGQECLKQKKICEDLSNNHYKMEQEFRLAQVSKDIMSEQLKRLYDSFCAIGDVEKIKSKHSMDLERLNTVKNEKVKLCD